MEEQEQHTWEDGALKEKKEGKIERSHRLIVGGTTTQSTEAEHCGKCQHTANEAEESKQEETRNISIKAQVQEKRSKL